MGAALITAAVVYILPPTFRATAIIATTVSGAPGLALSDSVVARTLITLGQPLPTDERTAERLRPHLRVIQDSGDVNASLYPEASEPNLAAAIANGWASQFVEVTRGLPVEDPS